MIKVRMIIAPDDTIVEKFRTREMPHVPRVGEKIVMLKRDFIVEEVAWDLEFPRDEVQAVLFLKELK